MNKIDKYDMLVLALRDIEDAVFNTEVTKDPKVNYETLSKFIIDTLSRVESIYTENPK